MTILCCLTTLGIVQLLELISQSAGYDKVLVVLASTIILGSESRGPDDHILLSHDSGSRITSRSVG
jgi:hypothetical protein